MSIGTLKETYVTTEKLLERLEEHFPQGDLDLVKRACAFAEEYFASVVHPTGQPYIQYAFSVAKLLADLGANLAVISATMVYPPPSVTENVLDALRKQFKDEDELLELVEEVLHLSQLEWDVWPTFLESHESRERKEILHKMYLLAIDEAKSEDQEHISLTVAHFQKREKQVENLVRMFLAAATDIRALIIKLADRLLFMRLLKDVSQTRKESLHYTLLAKITLAVYAPLADRLGMWQLKSELEDMSFRLLEPSKYKAIARQLADKKQEREDYIAHIVPIVLNKLKEWGIEKAEISGRAKHIYSIHQKMEAKQLTFEQINDLLGIRIIVDAREECYDAQEIIHMYWPPMTDVYNGQPGRDWIAEPKANRYQSLHTTIRIEDKTVEVQIRTHEMHEVAEYGAAAEHWRYKESKTYRKGKTPRVNKLKDQIWSEQLAELRKSLANVPTSAAPRRRNLLKHQIFVITPEGHVIDLSAGATPLDFAYRIHTDLGHRYMGAKVDDHIVRLDYELKNGEIVELITSRVRKGPSPEWLAISKDEEGRSNYMFARTQQARKKIHSWLNKHNAQS